MNFVLVLEMKRGHMDDVCDFSSMNLLYALCGVTILKHECQFGMVVRNC
jgi:hypothetical protein